MLPESDPTAAIAQLERASLRAVPHGGPTIGGWSVGLLGAAPRRIGSTTCLGMVPDDLAGTVDAVIDRSRQVGLPPTFRLSPIDGVVDDFLDKSGFPRQPGAIVLTSDDPTALGSRRVGASRRVQRHWLDDLRAFTEMSSERSQGVAQSLALLELPTFVAHLPGKGVGLAVVDGPLAGLFDIAVHPAHRRRGLGQALVDTLIGAAHEAGARRFWLQVDPSNHAALRLYRRWGFDEAYRYHYRTLGEGA